MSGDESQDFASIKDDGTRAESKIADKETEAEQVEVVNRQMAPKVSVKVERQQNLGHYNNATAQVFMSSGTLEELRGKVDSDGRGINKDVQKELSEIASDLEKLARNRVLDALKKHADASIEVDSDIHAVDS